MDVDTAAEIENVAHEIAAAAALYRRNPLLRTDLTAGMIFLFDRLTDLRATLIRQRGLAEIVHGYHTDEGGE